MHKTRKTDRIMLLLLLALSPLLPASTARAQGFFAPRFAVEEATIRDIHAAILTRRLTATELVKLYLARIKAYNGTCVTSPRASSDQSRRSRTLASSTP